MRANFLFWVCAVLPCIAAADVSPGDLDRQFSREVRPLLKQYCYECHNAKKHKDDVDLEQFSSASAIRKNLRAIEKPLEMLATGEMPPEKKTQPTLDERAKMVGWIKSFLRAEGLVHAGDPGRVVMRRLNNVEYANTTRDLTGAPINPVKEFPTDGAAGEGFVNVGDALAMSPALLEKYLGAAKDTAAHAVLLPDGFRFTASSQRGDWTADLLGKIRAFYSRYSDASGSSKINLQGIQFESNQGGRLPLEKYLSAALACGGTNIEAVARERSLSPKYLKLLLQTLNGGEPSPLLDAIRARWRDAKPDNAASLAKAIEPWENVLTKFQTVGQMKPWMVPENPEKSPTNSPIALPSGLTAEQRTNAFDAFRAIFPAAICYPKIVPTDEVITLTVFHREDENLIRLMLDETEKAQIDRLWDELHYVGRDALTMVDAYAQLLEFASQDGDPKKIFHLRAPIEASAAAFKKLLLESEPHHLDQLMDFASRAWRRPLTEAEQKKLRGLYDRLRAQELNHEDAFRLTLARVLVAPAFLYRSEQPASGGKPKPVSDLELANRLSYMLWASMPDDALRAKAEAGKLHDPDTLVAETKRLLADDRTRMLSTEFACQWLHIRDFDSLDEKSEKTFPTFTSLRADMYEESVRFFLDLFQHDGSVLEILDTDHTFLNESLARHYGIPGVKGPEFRRVDGVKKYGRGGVLAMATVLTKESGASRTSPILRGAWISETLLGDKLPRPPKNVPQLPESENDGGLTMRQITEKHTADPDCYKCHQRIDPFGYALERYDAIGRFREKDSAGLPIDARAQLKWKDNATLDGMPGLRDYLLTKRRDEFVQIFCRKLLGYALARSVTLSDTSLIEEMETNLRAHDYRFSAALETVLRSPQFRNQRGLDATKDGS